MSESRALLREGNQARRTKTSLVLCLLALVPLLVMTVLWTAANGRAPQVYAAYLETFFGPIVNISNSPDQTGSQHPRAVLATGGLLHVAWMDGILDPDKNFGPAYTTGRDTWAPYQWAAPNNNAGFTNPGIVLDSSGTVHLVWAVGTVLSGAGYTAPYEIYYAFKSVGGAWSTPVNISNEGLNTVYPSIAIDSQGRLWVAWQATSVYDEIYVASKPAGGAWEPAVNISNNGAKNQNPCLVVDAYDTPHVAWRSTAPGNWEIFYTKYQDGTWTAPGNLSATAKPSYFPRLAADESGNVYVAWEEDLGSNLFQIRSRRWDGSSWLAAKEVSPAGGKALYPSIAAENGNVYAVWQDYRDNAGYPEIYFSRSADLGETWQANENVSQNSTSSYWPDVVAEAGGMAHIFWQNMGPEILEIYYRLASLGVTPTPLTETPTPITPTPGGEPYGSVDIVAQQPPGSGGYTRLLSVDLAMQATSPIGANLLMRYANDANFGDGPGWVAYSAAVPNWSLLGPTGTCATKQVFAQYKDDQGNESQVYSDQILFDDQVNTAMQLNGGKTYTNRALVMIDSAEEPADCSGLIQMALSGNGITFTKAMPFFSQAYYMPAPSGPTTITVYTRYTDTAGNGAVLSDSIVLDTTAPSGTAPTLPASTTQLVVPATDMAADDTPSGVANVWFANNESGLWWVTPYLAPPHTYDWNLAYGGPPIQVPGTHVVYVKYEDNSGYGAFPGNVSPAYSATISVSGISNTYLPITAKRYNSLDAAPGPVESPDVGLTLISVPQQASPGEQILIWLFAQRDQHTPLEGTLRVVLPDGLRVVGAWSAYGHALLWADRVVISHERAWDQQSPFILIQAQVDAQSGPLLLIQGDMTWNQGATTAAPLLIENH